MRFSALYAFSSRTICFFLKSWGFSCVLIYPFCFNVFNVEDIEDLEIPSAA